MDLTMSMNDIRTRGREEYKKPEVEVFRERRDEKASGQQQE